MTFALCFNCGDTKFGALIPCPSCNAPASGDANLDIAFSDHRMSKNNLEKLGEVVAAIKTQSEDQELCFWTFIHYVSVHHPSILGVELNSDVQASAEAILSGLDLPEFTVELGHDDSDDSTGVKA